MEIAKVTSKGQITIPKEVRDELDLSPGSKVVFLKVGNEMVVRNASVESETLRQRSDELKQRWLAEAAAKYDIDLDEVRNRAEGKTTKELLEDVRAGFRKVIEENGLKSDEDIAKYFGVSEDDYVK